MKLQDLRVCFIKDLQKILCSKVVFKGLFKVLELLEVLELLVIKMLELLVIEVLVMLVMLDDQGA